MLPHDERADEEQGCVASILATIADASCQDALGLRIDV